MDAQAIWNVALEKIREKVSKPSFQTWFERTKAQSLEKNTFVLFANNGFSVDWLSSRYGNLIESVLREVTGNPGIRLRILCCAEETNDEETTYPKPRSTVEMLVEMENRLSRIEEKLDKLLEVLRVNAEK